MSNRLTRAERRQLKKKQKRDRNTHHKKAVSRGGGNDARNLTPPKRTAHEAYHQLFQNMQPPEIAATLTEKWIDPNYVLVAVKRADWKYFGTC